jgi:hypothetical protein
MRAGRSVPLARASHRGAISSSASPDTTQSAYGVSSSGLVVATGPPTTTTLPAARACAASFSSESRCTSMPDKNTASAHCSSSGARAWTFRSHSRTSQSLGTSAATVSSPSGGSSERFPISRSESSWPQ